ncbi:5'/3'-nucleotidase SurE [Methylophilaceae bacterium]|jgi:5'-nucleotidase|nr:5'/3'-nucleotidase SurE [Methylophilaceae bacterium]
MKILVSNDDGYLAPGLTILVDSLKKIADVIVVAPDKNKSGSSSSLSLNKEVAVNKINPMLYSVEGTPTDCVHIALTGLIPFKPDMVISGINDGANMGDDTIYSGTVGAAMEGFLLGIPSIAVSMGSSEPKYFETAAKVIIELITKHNKQPPKNVTLLNINVPDVPYSEIKGLEITRLGKRYEAQPAIRGSEKDGQDIFWVGPVGEPNDGGPGTDFFAIMNNYVSISPIQSDLTNHNEINPIKKWMEL